MISITIKKNPLTTKYTKYSQSTFSSQVFFNRRARRGLRRGRRGRTSNLFSLRSLRNFSATSAVNGFHFNSVRPCLILIHRSIQT
jgi:hypothetical protein